MIVVFVDGFELEQTGPRSIAHRSAPTPKSAGAALGPCPLLSPRRPWPARARATRAAQHRGAKRPEARARMLPRIPPCWKFFEPSVFIRLPADPLYDPRRLVLDDLEQYQ